MDQKQKREEDMTMNDICIYIYIMYICTYHVYDCICIYNISIYSIFIYYD